MMQAMDVKVTPSVAFQYNLTSPDTKEICRSLDNATTGSWWSLTFVSLEIFMIFLTKRCETTLQQLTNGPRSVGLGASNTTVVGPISSHLILVNLYFGEEYILHEPQD